MSHKEIKEALRKEFEKLGIKILNAPLDLSHKCPPDLKVVIRGKVAYFDIEPRGQYLEQCFDSTGRKK